jgi:DNA-binding PadR family transcriptional regulator
MSSTRTLILGAIGIHEPVHGYVVRRELSRWHADEWARLNPGSVYNAMRTLERQGLIEAVIAPEQARGPQRTSYRLTPSGREEFLTLVRDGLEVPAPNQADVLHAALCFIWALPREEVIELLERRCEAIVAERRAAETEMAEVISDPGRPDHVAEVIAVRAQRLGGELAWARSFVERIRCGMYVLAGETGGPAYVPSAPPINQVLAGAAGKDNFSEPPSMETA